MARYLEVAVLAIAAGTLAAGLAIMAYGITAAVTEHPGQPYPNVQHISPTPAPHPSVRHVHSTPTPRG